ncbi:DUF2066 domain-containing protein [Reinekea marinisedimentorum]|uniref:DUF2066 domain-containing protein n=1 Tax=Reinekea marinisedimentorum TaxID=230495 RepID=A0A4R3IB26_9GAMM|nr:DUF2066 domain-containing protein [Reinekea marinisedimentorum]TCS42650.1 hypothetical protein BCF53_103318 [Reinekea marinisedimentorum]
MGLTFIKQLFRFVGLMAVVGVYSFSYAATDVQLYNERVVISQNANQKEQNDAIRQAFERVLARVTGQQETLQNASVRQQLDSGSKYLTSFRFEPSDEFFTNILGEKVATKAMILEFDENSVNSLLVRSGLPVWGSRRPEILVWIADRSAGPDNIPGESESSELADTLEAEAQLRGLPYLLPIMDLTDTLNIKFGDLYGLFSADIESASARYQADSVLAGRIDKNGNAYQADWLVLFKGERIRVPTVQGSLNEVVAAGLAAVSGRLSAQYAYVLDPSSVDNLQVQVLNVPDAVTFARIEGYLESVNLISQLTLSSLSGGNVTFNVQVSGDQMQLVDSLELDGKLVPVPELTLEEQLDSMLVYRWVAN